MATRTGRASVRDFIVGAGGAYDAHPDPRKASFFRRQIQVVPPSAINGAYAVADTSTGTMAVSGGTYAALDKLLNHRRLTGGDFRTARNALVTLHHEFGHFAVPAGRDWMPGARRYNCRRGVRAIEEGVTELAAIDLDRFSGFVGRLGLDPDAERRILKANSDASYQNFVPAVETYLRAMTTDDPSYADALERVNAVDADQKATVLAEVALERTPLKTLVTGNRYAEIRAEVEDTIVRGFDDLPESDAARDDKQRKRGRQLGLELVANVEELTDTHEGIAARQSSLNRQWAASERRFAAAERSCADDLRRGRAGAMSGLATASIKRHSTQQQLRVERLALISEEASLLRAKVVAVVAHYEAQIAKADQRIANPVKDSDDHEQAGAHRGDVRGDPSHRGLLRARHRFVGSRASG